MWGLFAETSHWTLSDLQSRLSQPANHVKNVFLDKFCLYHNKGNHFKHYELRPEFRDTAVTVSEITGDDTAGATR